MLLRHSKGEDRLATIYLGMELRREMLVQAKGVARERILGKGLGLSLRKSAVKAG